MRRLFYTTSIVAFLFLFTIVGSVFAKSHITIGSSQEKTIQVQGQPAEIIYKDQGHENWRYGYSTITFDKKTNGVIGWNNTGNLKVYLLPGQHKGKSLFFSRGDHADTVLRLQGTPAEITGGIDSQKKVWRYGYSTVSFLSDRVVKWNNSGNLKVKLESNSHFSEDGGGRGYFTIGSSKNKVNQIQGTPASISNDPLFRDQEIWRFGYDTVTISKKSGQVTGWESSGGLKVRMIPEQNKSAAKLYDKGSHKSEVLRIEGTPAGVRSDTIMGHELWRYGYSTVTISLYNNRVSSYMDRGNLHVPKGKLAKKIKQIKYHWKNRQITLFYDENMIFGDMFSINDKRLGQIYGVISNDVIGFYDRNLAQIDLFAYLMSEKTFAVKYQGHTYSQEWLADFTTKLNGIYVSDSDSKLPYSIKEFTLHNLIQNSGVAISGSSIDLGSVILDEFKLLDNTTLSGSRVKMGNIILGNWWTSDGNKVKGTSHQVGNITFHHFVFPDGSEASSSTLGIGIR